MMKLKKLTLSVLILLTISTGFAASANFKFVDEGSYNSKDLYSVNINSVNGIADNVSLRYKATLLEGNNPVNNQVIYYPDVGLSTWSSFSTNSDGVGYFGPESGFTLEILSDLTTSEGVTTPFYTDLNNGNYDLKIEIVNASDYSQSFVSSPNYIFSKPASTVYVDDEGNCANIPCYTSIQTAIEEVSTDGVVNVMEGTYSESVLVDKTLTLNGIGETKPVISGDSANYVMKITGNEVIVDNFEINGGGSGTGDNSFDYGVLISNCNSAELRNSEVTNIWKNSANGIGVELSINSIIHDNVISSFHKRGIKYINSDGQFYNNEVIGDNVDGTDRVQNLVNLWGGSNVEIYGNILYNALSDGETRTWSSPAIFVSSYGGNSDSFADIHDNEIYECDSGVVITSVYAETDSSSAVISNNNMHDLENAIIFEKLTGTATVSENTFTNNENNFYHVTNVEGTDNYYGGIQSAIDNASSGDTVNVVAGTYFETLSVDVPNIMIKSIDDAEDTIINAEGSGKKAIRVYNVNGEDLKTISGFKILGSEGKRVIQADSDDDSSVLIKDNIILIKGSDTARAEGVTTHQRVILRNNTFEGNNGNTMAVNLRWPSEFPSYTDSSIIEDNMIRNTLSGVLAGDSSNTIIKNNQFNNVVTLGVAVVSNSEDVNNVRISNNDFSNLGVSVGFIEDSTASPTSIIDCSVNHNTFNNAGNGWDLSPESISSGKVVLTDKVDGQGDMNPYSGDQNITGYVNATLNYWASSNPDFANLISGNVLVNPYYEIPGYSDYGLTYSNVQSDYWNTPLVDTEDASQGELNERVNSYINGHDIKPIKLNIFTELWGWEVYDSITVEQVGGNSHLQLWVNPPETNEWFDISNGWPEDGANGLPANFSMSINVYPVSDQDGTYPVTTKLLNNGNVVAEGGASLHIKSVIPEGKFPTDVSVRVSGCDSVIQTINTPSEYTVMVSNTGGNLLNNVRLQALGLNESWFGFNDSVSLTSGESKSLTYSLTPNSLFNDSFIVQAVGTYNEGEYASMNVRSRCTVNLNTTLPEEELEEEEPSTGSNDTSVPEETNDTSTPSYNDTSDDFNNTDVNETEYCPPIVGYKIVDNDCVYTTNGCEVDYVTVEECESNLVAEEPESKGLIQRIIEWFLNLFK